MLKKVFNFLLLQGMSNKLEWLLQSKAKPEYAAGHSPRRRHHYHAGSQPPFPLHSAAMRDRGGHQEEKAPTHYRG